MLIAVLLSSCDNSGTAVHFSSEKENTENFKQIRTDSISDILAHYSKQYSRTPLNENQGYTKRLRYCILNDLGNGSTCLEVVSTNNQFNYYHISSFSDENAVLIKGVLEKEKIDNLFSLVSKFRSHNPIEELYKPAAYTLSLETNLQEESYPMFYRTNELTKLKGVFFNIKKEYPKLIEQVNKIHLPVDTIFTQ